MKKMQVTMILQMVDEEDTTNVSEVMIDHHKELEVNAGQAADGNYKLLSFVCQDLGETSIYANRIANDPSFETDTIRWVG